MEPFKRSELTFAQFEGVSPLPTQLKTKQTSRVLRARLWDVVYSACRQNMRGPYSLSIYWADVSKDYQITQFGRFSDEISASLEQFVKVLKPQFESTDYVKVYGTVEWFARRCPNLAPHFERVLEEQRSAYRLVEGSMFAITSEQEGDTIREAVAVLDETGLGAARKHLVQAGSLLTSGRHGDSMRESIHAVESVARTLTGKLTFKDALQELIKSHPMHQALRDGFNKIYGYTSDANGIRHPMLGDEGVQGGEHEAIFMLGACAAFCTYMARISKPQS